MLTGNYMPEFGRASGGQIRMVTKSGSNRYSAAAPRSSTATTSCRPTPGRATAARTRIENSGPAPFDYKQYGYSFGGPMPLSMFKDKLFFFGAQEWVNFFQVQTNTAHRADREDAPRATSASCSTRTTASSPAPGSSSNPADRPAVPGQHHPGRTASRRTAWRCCSAFPLPTPGFRQGTEQRDHHEPQPAGPAQGQHPLRLPVERSQPVHLPATRSYNWMAVDAFRGDVPVRAHRLGSAEHARMTASWTSTLSNNADQRSQLHLFARRGVHQRLHGAMASTSAASTGSTTRTSSRRTRRSRQDARPSRSRLPARSTAARIRPPRPGPIHTVRTRPPG